MKLGLVTYNLARDWTLTEILDRCESAGLEGVELRTMHEHGVEATLNQEERREVRALFKESSVALAGLGTVFAFDALDPDEVRHNIEGTMDYVRLAADLGCSGVKVRPNGLHTGEGVDADATLRQIGDALRECAEFAAPYGVEIRLEIHGNGTQELRHIARILDYADHDNVSVCWNSNPSDVVDGSIRKNFDRVADRIHAVHMRDLYLSEYPWVELFRLLMVHGYQGYCLAEIAGSPDPARVLFYYRALYDAYLKLAQQS